MPDKEQGIAHAAGFQQHVRLICLFSYSQRLFGSVDMVQQTFFVRKFYQHTLAVLQRLVPGKENAVLNKAVDKNLATGGENQAFHDPAAGQMPARFADEIGPLRKKIRLFQADAIGISLGELAWRASLAVPAPFRCSSDVEIVIAIGRRGIAAKAVQPLVHEFIHARLYKMRPCERKLAAPGIGQLRIHAQPATGPGKTSQQRIDHGLVRAVIGGLTGIIGDTRFGCESGQHFIVVLKTGLGQQNAQMAARMAFAGQFKCFDKGFGLQNKTVLSLALLAKAGRGQFRQPGVDIVHPGKRQQLLHPAGDELDGFRIGKTDRRLIIRWQRRIRIGQGRHLGMKCEQTCFGQLFQMPDDGHYLDAKTLRFAEKGLVQ